MMGDAAEDLIEQGQELYWDHLAGHTRFDDECPYCDAEETIMNCPYCHAEMKLTDSEVIYGRSYGNVWLCENWPGCDVFVGCHKGTAKPLGTPANGLLRNWRKKCHAEFDRLWKSGRMKRTAAYAWMAEQLGIPIEQAHIAMLTLEQCQQLHDRLQQEV